MDAKQRRIQRRSIAKLEELRGRFHKERPIEAAFEATLLKAAQVMYGVSTESKPHVPTTDQRKRYIKDYQRRLCLPPVVRVPSP